MLFNHLERLKIIFNQLGLLCQFKELLMRVKFVNSLWAAFFCVYVVEGHAEMGGGRYQKGCSRSCYYIIISYLHEAHTFSVYLWVHQEFNCYNLLSTIHELSQAESLAAQNRESQNFFFFLNTPIGKWERAGPLQYVKQPSSLHSPPVCPVNHSLISSLSLPNNITCFLWPQDDKQVPIWGLTLPSPRATHHTPACSHDLLFLFAKDSRSWPALGFFLTLLFNFIPFILSSCRGSPYATHFLLLMLATCPFWSVCFTENHQGEKEKITKEPTRKGCDSIRMLI